MLYQGRTGSMLARGIAMAVIVIAGTASTALAAAPANDDRGAASVVGDVPYEDNVQTTDATAQDNDPDCLDLGPGPTVWYTLTPQDDEVLVATTAGSDYDTTLTLASTGPGGLEVIDCNDDSNDGSLTSRLAWHADAGVEYLLMVGSFSGDGGDLRFVIRRAPPPPSFELRIYRSGRVTKRGMAEVRGVLRCEGTQDRQHLGVSGRQDMGRRILRGFGGRSVACNEPWTVKIRHEEFRFAPGFVVVRAAVEWCTDFDCGVERALRAVRIR